MSSYEILLNLNIIDWFTISLGVEEDWISRKEVLKYALTCLEVKGDKDKKEEKIIRLITNIDSMSKEKIVQSISTVTGTTMYDKNHYLEKWILADLLLIKKQNIGNDEKINQLQDLIVKFNYYDSLLKFSIYAGNQQDPLIILDEYIAELQSIFNR